MTTRARHTRTSAAGFSLVEVLIALVIFVMGVYGLLDLSTTSRRINAKFSKRFQAAVLAEGRMAILRAAGRDAILAEAASSSTTLPLAHAAPLDGAPGFAWRVALAEPSGWPGALKVGVTVSWDEDGAPAQAAVAADDPSPASGVTRFSIEEMLPGPPAPSAVEGGAQ